MFWHRKKKWKTDIRILSIDKKVEINETPAGQSGPVPAWDPEQCLSALAVDMLFAQL